MFPGWYPSGRAGGYSFSSPRAGEHSLSYPSGECGVFPGRGFVFLVPGEGYRAPSRAGLRGVSRYQGRGGDGRRRGQEAGAAAATPVSGLAAGNGTPAP